MWRRKKPAVIFKILCLNKPEDSADKGQGYIRSTSEIWLLLHCAATLQLVLYGAEQMFSEYNCSIRCPTVFFIFIKKQNETFPDFLLGCLWKPVDFHVFAEKNQMDVMFMHAFESLTIVPVFRSLQWQRCATLANISLEMKSTNGWLPAQHRLRHKKK